MLQSEGKSATRFLFHCGNDVVNFIKLGSCDYFQQSLLMATIDIHDVRTMFFMNKISFTNGLVKILAYCSHKCNVPKQFIHC